MYSRVVSPLQAVFYGRLAFITILTLLLSGWTTCNALFAFHSCQSSVPLPQIGALSPGTIPGNGESVLLTVSGSGFVPHSQIMLNGAALQTVFIDSGHLQAMITQQTLESLGGSASGTVQIGVNSPPSKAVLGCPNGGSSATMVLVIG